MADGADTNIQSPSNSGPAQHQTEQGGPDATAGDSGLTDALDAAWEQVWEGEDPNSDVWDDAETRQWGPDRDTETGRFKSRRKAQEADDGEEGDVDQNADEADEDTDAEDDDADDADDDDADVDEGDGEAEEDADEDDADADEDDDEGEDAELDDEWKDAPDGFHDQAKEAWKKTPKEVRAETQRRLKEMGDGLTQFQNVLRPLQPWMEAAMQAGTDLPSAMANYVQIDQAIHQNPIEGMRMALHQAGFSLDDVVAQYLEIDPDEQLSSANTNLQQAAQYIRQLEQGMQQMQHQMREIYAKNVSGELATFRAAHPRMEEPGFEERMADLINQKLAFTIEEAYVMVDRERFQPAPSKAKAITPGRQKAAKGEDKAKAKPAGQNRSTSKKARKSPASSPGRTSPRDKVPENAMDALQRAALKVGF